MGLTARILFGSDYPFIMQDVISGAIQFIASCDRIAETTRARLWSENARQLFPRLNKVH
jgi:predicted TIM-barrel fold metal-dependent hydrolase